MNVCCRALHTFDGYKLQMALSQKVQCIHAKIQCEFASAFCLFQAGIHFPLAFHPFSERIHHTWIYTHTSLSRWTISVAATEIILLAATAAAAKRYDSLAHHFNKDDANKTRQQILGCYLSLPIRRPYFGWLGFEPFSDLYCGRCISPYLKFERDLESKLFGSCFSFHVTDFLSQLLVSPKPIFHSSFAMAIPNNGQFQPQLLALTPFHILSDATFSFSAVAHLIYVKSR